MPLPNFLSLYTPILGWTLLGWLLGRLLPPSTPAYLGRFLFWIGVPLGIVAFLRHVELTFSLWIAPVVAWVAILFGLAVAWWLSHLDVNTQMPGKLRRENSIARVVWAVLQGCGLQAFNSRTGSRQTQGSFLLASMVGNTGYIGYPISLALVGPQYFAWALFYDLLGSTPGSYGLGVALASRYGGGNHQSLRQPVLAMVKNPALWSFALGIAYRNVPLPEIAEASLRSIAWFIVSLSLVLVGMRLSSLTSFKSVKPAIVSVVIKMLLVPLVLGIVLWSLGITGLVHRAILLQMAMPPAFATLVLAEAYELDQEMSVTALIVGCLGLLILLPVWLLLFGA